MVNRRKLFVTLFVSAGFLSFLIGLPLYLKGCREMEEGCFATVLNPTKLLPTLNWKQNQCCSWCSSSSNKTETIDPLANPDDSHCCAYDPHNCFYLVMDFPWSGLGTTCGFRGQEVISFSLNFLVFNK